MSNDVIIFDHCLVDNFGYLRDKKGYLIHRTLAFRFIYMKNRNIYQLPFKQYQVHHRDYNKLNNDIFNLIVLTYDEHQMLHKVCYKCPKWKTECCIIYSHKYKCPKGYSPICWLEGDVK